MGNCSTDKGQTIYLKHSREQIDAHCVALIKQDHFFKREPLLKKQALDDVSRIIDASMSLIRSKEHQMIADYNREIVKVKQNEKKVKKLEKQHITIEDYVGLAEAKEEFQDFVTSVEQKFATIKAQLETNMNTTFQSIHEDIESKIVPFQETEGLKKEDVDSHFYKWRLTNRDKVKQTIVDLESQFRDGLTHDYFRNKLKNVVSADEIKQITKRKTPPALASEIQIEEEMVLADTAVTHQGWFCCMPKR